ncbi:MAG: TolC family protein [Planctomycetota bacterium]|jgi:outer membrane protein TolC
MKHVCGKYIRILAGILAVLQLAGCVSSEKYYEDVSLSREAAYRQWKNRKDRQERSQPVISGQLSITDCTKLALVNNKALQSIVQERQIARGERLKSYSAILPNVNLTGDYTRLDGVTSFEIDTPSGKEKIQFGDEDTYSTVLTVTQPIFAGGAIPARINAAKLLSLFTDETVRAAVQEVVYAAEHAYYDVLLSQELFKISADAVRSSKAHLDNAKQRQQGGIASEFDVLRAEVELSNFQAEHITNKNAISVSKASLIKVMGISQDSDFVLSDELLYVPSNIAMEQAVEAAYRNRPDLLGREFDIKMKEEMLKIARSQYYPMVNGYFSNTWAKPDPHNMMEIEWGHAWQGGITASLPIFDGFLREGEIVAQKARLKQGQIDLIDAEETALFELTRAQLGIENTAEFIESQRLNLTRAEEGLRLAEVGYREGANTQLEMIDAQAALTTAKANHYQAIYAHIIAKLDFQKAMGTLASVESAEPEGRAQNIESTGTEETGVGGNKDLYAGD